MKDDRPKPVGKCRVCGSEDLQFLFSLGDQFINDFVEPGKERAGKQYPLELELCRNPDCQLVQLRHTAPQDFLYTRYYWYKSGVTDTMRAALREVAETVAELVQLKRGDIVLDIGSNDGTLLHCFSSDLLRVGVEPADNLATKENYEGLELIHDFWPVKGTFLPHDKAKVITALGMFYDLEDPVSFVKAVGKALAPDGLFVAQLMCLRNMVELGDVGNINHEHLEYYSLQSLTYLFEQGGLEIIDIEHNSVNGSSYRLYARRLGTRTRCKSGSFTRMARAAAKETRLADPHFYDEFFTRLQQNKAAVVNFVRRVVNQGKRVWVYGASTKGNCILQFYGLDYALIEAAAERTPSKWGKVTVGTGIPIKAEQEFRDAQPDYALILPYAFTKEFVEREKDWMLQGGQFIVPLPEPYLALRNERGEVTTEGLR